MGQGIAIPQEGEDPIVCTVHARLLLDDQSDADTALLRADQCAGQALITKVVGRPGDLSTGGYPVDPFFESIAQRTTRQIGASEMYGRSMGLRRHGRTTDPRLLGGDHIVDRVSVAGPEPNWNTLAYPTPCRQM